LNPIQQNIQQQQIQVSNDQTDDYPQVPPAPKVTPTDDFSPIDSQSTSFNDNTNICTIIDTKNIKNLSFENDNQSIQVDNSTILQPKNNKNAPKQQNRHRLHRRKQKKSKQDKYLKDLFNIYNNFAHLVKKGYFKTIDDKEIAAYRIALKVNVLNICEYIDDKHASLLLKVKKV
jgi:hypothetical protein